jgi:ribose transport system substrate-binding protein
MSRVKPRGRPAIAGLAALVLCLSACGSLPSAGSGGSASGGSGSGGSGSCDDLDLSALEHTEVPESLDPATSVPDISQMTIRSDDLGTQESLEPVWWNTLEITAEQAKQVCELGLKAVILDWDQVLYNQVLRSGIKDVLSAVGIEVVRETSFSFDPNGLAGNLSAVLPLSPDIIFTGGTVDPTQFASLLAPARAQDIEVISWGVGAKEWKTGPGQDLTALVGYDFYALGQQMADAVCAKYPDGATLGYVHWINNFRSIILREQGFLDGLADCPQITVVADGGKADPAAPNSGYSDPNAAQGATQAFLVRHPEVDVLFAAWEDPPALGQLAAIQSAGREGQVDVVTMDLGTTGAEQLASGGAITVDMAQAIYDGGRAQAMLAALAQIGEDTPPFVIVPTFATTDANLEDAWDYMHGPAYPCCSG